MKQMLLGTPVGKLALYLRDKFQLLRSIFQKNGQPGTILNDQLAAELMVKVCRPKKTFIDVGSHIGSVISSVHEFDTTISIIAIEAMPDKAVNLRKKFPYIELHQCAVSNTDGETTFFVDTKYSGYSSLAKPNEKDANNRTEITVPLKRLDTILNPKEVDVIKIDVEGAELGVLQGAERLIKDNRPLIMFESASLEDLGLGFSKEALWKWFDDRDFIIVAPNRLAHNGPGLGLDGFLEAHHYPRRTSNYFAIPREKRENIKNRARTI